MDDHYRPIVGKPSNQANSAFYPFGVDKWVVSWNGMWATVYGWRHLVKATEVTAGLAEINDSLPPGLPVHRDQLWAKRSVTRMGKLYPFYITY